MRTSELPNITGSATSSTAYGLADLSTGHSMFSNVKNQLSNTNVHGQALNAYVNQVRNAQQQFNSRNDAFAQIRGHQEMKVKEQTMSRRLVQVYIADPDENLQLDKAMIYQGEQKFTDLTDQELFFEIDMARILKEHNEFRTKQLNKKVKERVEHLEPAKIRDLKMVVVTIASF
jgi:hypothetical protein